MKHETTCILYLIIYNDDGSSERRALSISVFDPLRLECHVTSRLSVAVAMD
jgi:hypothetical protein